MPHAGRILVVLAAAQQGGGWWLSREVEMTPDGLSSALGQGRRCPPAKLGWLGCPGPTCQAHPNGLGPGTAAFAWRWTRL